MAGVLLQAADMALKGRTDAAIAGHVAVVAGQRGRLRSPLGNTGIPAVRMAFGGNWRK